MRLKKSLAAGFAVLGLMLSTAAPALAAGTTIDSYSGKSQGYWGAKWWDNNSEQHTIWVRNNSGCTTTLAGEKSVTYRMHKLNGIFPADSLGDREFACSFTGERSWSVNIKGNHEYQWQIVGINGQGKGGKASASRVTARY